MIFRQAILKTKGDSEEIGQIFLPFSKKIKKKTHTWKIQVYIFLIYWSCRTLLSSSVIFIISTQSSFPHKNTTWSTPVISWFSFTHISYIYLSLYLISHWIDKSIYVWEVLTSSIYLPGLVVRNISYFPFFGNNDPN